MWKKCVKEALLSGGCDTVLLNKTKRYLTIAFTVLEEICFFTAKRVSTIPSGENHGDQNKEKNNVELGLAR